MTKISVAVLRGGPSPEYEVSLKTGGHIISTLRQMEDKYEPVDIFISRDGEWHRGGLVHEPHQALRHIDVVWNGMHGAYGEDGQVQKILDNLQIPYIGSGAAASSLAMNKNLAKRVYNLHSMPTPNHDVLIDGEVSEAQLIYIFRNYLHPVIVKPASSGSSLGVKLAHSFHELKEAVKHAFEHSPKVLVEEFIRGKEATCGVVENLRGEKFYALLPVEIRKSEKHFFDYESKYSGETEEHCPGNFTRAESKMIQDLAKRAHEALGLNHYSRSDFMVTPRGRVYILETNSLPGLTEQSLFPKSLLATGLKTHEFAEHCINLALKKVY